MSRGLLLPSRGDHDPVALATRAEALGYDSVWLSELWGESASVLAAQVAAATDRVDLGTAILNVFSRTPAVLAMTAASLDRATGGRFVLGVGTSTRGAIEGIHGRDFERPVRRAHETIELVGRLTRSDAPVDYEGELLSVSGVPGLDREVPIYHAALGPANRRVVGRLADGWIPHNVPFPDLDDAFETVAETAREAGRDPEAIEVAPYVPAAVSEDGEAARDALRGHVAYYVGSGEGYRRAVADRFPDAAERIAETWAAGERDRARAAVTGKMVDALGVAGTPEAARERLRDLEADTVVDRPLLVIPDGADEAIVEGTIEALAPDGEGQAAGGDGGGPATRGGGGDRGTP